MSRPKRGRKAVAAAKRPTICDPVAQEPSSAKKRQRQRLRLALTQVCDRCSQTICTTLVLALACMAGCEPWNSLVACVANSQCGSYDVLPAEHFTKRERRHPLRDRHGEPERGCRTGCRSDSNRSLAAWLWYAVHWQAFLY